MTDYFEEWKMLLDENIQLYKACRLYREASIQAHTGHFDKSGQHGVNCPECARARQLRTEAYKIMEEITNENRRIKRGRNLRHITMEHAVGGVLENNRADQDTG